jgi:putative FmdB family regulatory protein
MPLIQFKCGCEAITEKLVPAYRLARYPNTTTCTTCGGEAQRILSAPAPPQFTGSGFYATDYKGK